MNNRATGLNLLRDMVYIIVTVTKFNGNTL